MLKLYTNIGLTVTWRYLIDYTLSVVWVVNEPLHLLMCGRHLPSNLIDSIIITTVAVN